MRREIEKVPKELTGPAGDIYRHGGKAPTVFVLFCFELPMTKVHEEEDKKKRKYSFQAELRGNIKEPGLNRFESNAVSPDEESLSR